MYGRSMRSAFLAAPLLIIACSASPDSIGASESAQISDIVSIKGRPDGLFDVVCKDGRHEVANEAEIHANTICSQSSCAAVNTCESAHIIGAVSGDEGADSLKVTGTASQWVWVQVTENDDTIAGSDVLAVRATLKSPPGTNFDLYVHSSTTGLCGGAPVASSKTPLGADTAGVGVTDVWGVNDSYYVAVEVRHTFGDCDPSKPWELTIEGNK
jgi:hypothetical protein